MEDIMKVNIFLFVIIFLSFIFTLSAETTVSKSYLDFGGGYLYGSHNISEFGIKVGGSIRDYRYILAVEASISPRLKGYGTPPKEGYDKDISGGSLRFIAPSLIYYPNQDLQLSLSAGLSHTYADWYYVDERIKNGEHDDEYGELVDEYFYKIYKSPAIKFSIGKDLKHHKSNNHAILLSLQAIYVTNPALLTVGAFMKYRYSQAKAVGASTPPSTLRTATLPVTIPQNEGDIVSAVNLAIMEIMKTLDKKSIIAVVNVASTDAEITDFIVSETEHLLIKNSYQIVVKNELSRVRAEKAISLNGDLDDSIVVEIGKLVGADVVLTGAITGRGSIRRLRIRAIDTKTSQVVGSASEAF